MRGVRVKGALIYLAVWAVLILLLFTCSGCARKTYENIIRDTITVERVDSVIVKMRKVDVDVPVPQITLEQWVPMDTLSVLDNGLYISTVEVVDGQIHHTLRPVEGAVVQSTVLIADTTHIQKEAVRETHNERKTVTIKEEENWFAKTRRKIGDTAIVITFIFIAFLLVYFAVRRLQKG